MHHSLVIGSSGGIGAALCRELTARGGAVVGLSRSGDGLDLGDAGSVRRVLRNAGGPFDLVMIATGALEIEGAGPEKTVRRLDRDVMLAQFALNAVGPALVLAQMHDLLCRDRRGVCAVLSARVGSIGDNRLGGWISYRAAKAAVNQIVRTASIELGRTHKQAICVALHPGTVQTGLTARYAGGHATVPPRTAAGNLLDVVDGLSRDQNGGFYDWAGKPIPW